MRLPLRWVAVLVFVFASVLNYLDRSMLATMLEIWRARGAFPISYEQYGGVLAVFGICYALAAPLMGAFLDRAGLNVGISVSVALWSLIIIAHGWVHDVRGLLFWRGLLGIAEASGISAAAKVNATYLLPKERAVGAAMAQLGLSIGAGVAPAFTVYMAEQYDWRWAFYAAGALGLVWIPIWIATSAAIPASPASGAESGGRMDSWAMLRDQRLWALIAANFLSMTFYTLWTNWTPTYLVRMHHLTPKDAAAYAWAVPLAGYCGAFAGGSLSWYWIARGGEPAAARKQVCFLSAALMLLSMAIPLLPTPLLATAGMCWSFFWMTAFSTNLYTLPVDIYGALRAAFGVSALVFAYGAMQAVVSRPIGTVIEQYGFTPVCITFALLPMLAYALLRFFVHAARDGSPVAGRASA